MRCVSLVAASGSREERIRREDRVLFAQNVFSSLKKLSSIEPSYSIRFSFRNLDSFVAYSFPQINTRFHFWSNERTTSICRSHQLIKHSAAMMDGILVAFENSFARGVLLK